jgi:hypothetical protein
VTSLGPLYDGSNTDKVAALTHFYFGDQGFDGMWSSGPLALNSLLVVGSDKIFAQVRSVFMWSGVQGRQIHGSRSFFELRLSFVKLRPGRASRWRSASCYVLLRGSDCSGCNDVILSFVVLYAVRASCCLREMQRRSKAERTPDC